VPLFGSPSPHGGLAKSATSWHRYFPPGLRWLVYNGHQRSELSPSPVPLPSPLSPTFVPHAAVENFGRDRQPSFVERAVPQLTYTSGADMAQSSAMVHYHQTSVAPHRGGLPQYSQGRGRGRPYYRYDDEAGRSRRRSRSPERESSQLASVSLMALTHALEDRQSSRGERQSLYAMAVQAREEVVHAREQVDRVIEERK
jgi:hypothetical protein